MSDEKSPIEQAIEDAASVTEQDDLIRSFGEKVPYCVGCGVGFNEDQVHIIEGAKGKQIKACPHCGDTLTQRRAERISNDLTNGAVLYCGYNTPRSTVIRHFDTPYGRVKLLISVNSWFAPSVELDGVASPEIKSLIDNMSDSELFAAGSDPMKAFATLGGKYMDLTALIHKLRYVIRTVHRDPNAPAELDFDQAYKAA